MNYTVRIGPKAVPGFSYETIARKEVVNITHVSRLLLFPFCIAARHLAIMYMIQKKARYGRWKNENMAIQICG
jgi:hypothetical protein